MIKNDACDFNELWIWLYHLATIYNFIKDEFVKQSLAKRVTLVYLPLLS